MLAKIHSKKFQFYTKHLTLREIHKKRFIGFVVNIYKLFTKKISMLSSDSCFFRNFFYLLEM